jgi:hypothetical protein
MEFYFSPQTLLPMSDNTEDFKPYGAIAFFILLVAFGALIWFTIYDIQLERH